MSTAIRFNMINKLLGKLLNKLSQQEIKAIPSIPNEISTDFINQDAIKLDRFKYMTEIPVQVFEKNLALILLSRIEEKGTWRIYQMDFKQSKDY